MELTLKGISKSFGAGNVLDGVDLCVRSGEITALLGENGAGKSTLMNIVGGVFHADRGEMLLDGKKVTFASPAASLRAGIAFIHQELNLVNDLTVYENIFLSSFKKKGIFLDRDAMKRETAALFEKLGISIDPSQKVGTLDASYKQMVEIARALHAEASLIIMDEPTASLNAQEIARVFSIMRTLKSQGIAMIFISHKLREVMEICDNYAVLRNGKMVETGLTKDVTVRRLAELMVGHNVETGESAGERKIGEEILRLEGLSDGENFFDVSLSLKKGEVLGVTGLLGDGRSELFGTVFGAYGRGYHGKIFLENKEIRPSDTSKALSAGIAYLPKNRKENGVIADMSILDNGTAVTLNAFTKLGFIDRTRQKESFRDEVNDLRIRMSDENNPITSLSGGNQQKVVLAKWLLADPKVLILDNPTQGVDVGAKEEIYAIITKLASEGIAVVVLSAEAQEIIRVADRCLVMFHGRVAGEVTGEDMNETNMMFLATGGKERTDHE